MAASTFLVTASLVLAGMRAKAAATSSSRVLALSSRPLRWTVRGCLSVWREAVVSTRWEGCCGSALGGCGVMVVGWWLDVDSA